MGKNLYPRFKCPLCGWLAYYSMLEKGPHKLEVKGMKVEGFGGISYHKIRGVKKEYKEFLRVKVRELAKELGLKIVGEEEIDEYEEDVELDVDEKEDEEELTEDDLEALLLPSEKVKSVPIEYIHSQQMTTEAKGYKKLMSAYTKVIEKDNVISAGVEDSYVRTVNTEFID